MSKSNSSSPFVRLIDSMDRTLDLKEEDREKVQNAEVFFEKVLFPEFAEEFAAASEAMLLIFAMGNPSFIEMKSSLMSLLFTGATVYHMFLLEHGVDLSKVESLANDQQRLG